MPSRQISTPHAIPEPLVAGLRKLRDELDVPGEFSDDVIRDAERSIASVELPTKDLTHIEFITIDPEGSMDLDQAMFIERDGDGYIVWYAIADVAAWVDPNSPLDNECHRRCQTFYAPNTRSPLHPAVLSEDAASLLAVDPPRPAMVWKLGVNAQGENTSAHVERAMVRNREKLTYVDVQSMIDSGQGVETLHLLKEVGQLRERIERDRGGVSLPIPEQEVDAVDGTWVLSFRSPLPVEGWNAQISLMTGIAAAQMMIDHKVGILRTLPPVDPRNLRKLRLSARALHITWPEHMDYPEFLRSLDSNEPRHMAMLQKCTMLFRGAGYMSFNGALPADDHRHNALATHYSHTTAPLRRLVDRYVLEVCASICAGEDVPQWVLDKLPGLPENMQQSNRREKAYERGIANLVEALVLRDRVGEEFTGTVVDEGGDKWGASVLIVDPAVEARVEGYAPLGEEIRVRLESVDLVEGEVVFQSLAHPDNRR